MNGGGIPPGPTKVNITSRFSFTYYCYVVGVEGSDLGKVMTNVSQRYGVSNFVDIHKFSVLEITVLQENKPSFFAGGCFYDKNQEPISGFCFASESPVGNIVHEISVPVGAYYLRTSRLRSDSYGPFSCYGIGVIV